MAIILSKAEAQALSDLIAAGQRLYQSSQIIKGTQGRSILRTDTAMMSFKRSLDAVDHIRQDKLNVTGQ